MHCVLVNAMNHLCSFELICSRESILSLLTDLYHRSTFLFIAGISVLLYLSSSVIIHYSPVIFGIVQFVAMYMQGEIED